MFEKENNKMHIVFVNKTLEERRHAVSTEKIPVFVEALSLTRDWCVFKELSISFARLAHILHRMFAEGRNNINKEHCVHADVRIIARK